MNDLDEATSSLRRIDPEFLAWRTVSPVALTEHGIIPRDAVEPGLRLLAQRGQIPSIKDLSAAVSPFATAAEINRTILHELVRIIKRELDVARGNEGGASDFSEYANGGGSSAYQQPGQQPEQQPGPQLGQQTGRQSGQHSRRQPGRQPGQRAENPPRFDYVFPLPLDLLVDKRSARRPSSSVCPHCRSHSLPPGSLYRINKAVLIVSPELLLTQLAGQCVGAPRIVIAGGLELAGTYSLLPSGFVDCGKLIEEGRDFVDRNGTLLGDGYVQARGILRPDALAATLSHTHHGHETCEAALPYIAPGSASPFETYVNTSLSPHRRRGGFCAGHPALNTPVPLSPEAQALYDNHKSCVLDLLYSDNEGRHVDVEPGGDAWHRGSWKQDNKRRQALEHDGYDVVNVSWDEFADFSRWSLIADSIASRVGRKRHDTPAYLREKQALVHADLINPSLLRESFGPPTAAFQ